jgi:hypothetical protein
VRKGHDLLRGDQLKVIQQIICYRVYITVLTKYGDRTQTAQANIAHRLYHGWAKLNSVNPDLMADDQLDKDEDGTPILWASIAQMFYEGSSVFEGAWEEVADLSAPGNTRHVLSHYFRLSSPLCRGTDITEECLHWKGVGKQSRTTLLSGDAIMRSGILSRRACRRLLSCQVRNPLMKGVSDVGGSSRSVATGTEPLMSGLGEDVNDSWTIAYHYFLHTTLHAHATAPPNDVSNLVGMNATDHAAAMEFDDSIAAFDLIAQPADGGKSLPRSSKRPPTEVSRTLENVPDDYLPDGWAVWTVWGSRRMTKFGVEPCRVLMGLAGTDGDESALSAKDMKKLKQRRIEEERKLNVSSGGEPGKRGLNIDEERSLAMLSVQNQRAANEVRETSLASAQAEATVIKGEMSDLLETRKLEVSLTPFVKDNPEALAVAMENIVKLGKEHAVLKVELRGLKRVFAELRAATQKPEGPSQ